MAKFFEINLEHIIAIFANIQISSINMLGNKFWAIFVFSTPINGRDRCRQSTISMVVLHNQYSNNIEKKSKKNRYHTYGAAPTFSKNDS